MPGTYAYVEGTTCVNIHERKHRATLLLAATGWYCRYPSAENNKAANMADGEALSQSRVEREFSAEEVTRLEDEEFSVWCDKTCQMIHLTKMTMKEMSCREGLSILLTKFHIYSLLTTSH